MVALAAGGVFVFAGVECGHFGVTEPVTVAVKMTFCPNIDGLTEDATTVVVLGKATETVSVFEVLLPVLLSVQPQDTLAEFWRLGGATVSTFTVKVMIEFPPAAIGVAVSVQVTIIPIKAPQDHPVPEPLTKFKPAGNISSTVIVPLVAAVPPFVTVNIY